MTVISRHPPWLCSGQDRVFPILGALMGSWQPRTVLARICLHLLLGVCGISATDCQLACAPSSPRLALGRSPGRAVLHLGLVATTQAKCEPRNSLQPAGWGPWMPHPVLCERSTKAEGSEQTRSHGAEFQGTQVPPTMPADDQLPSAERLALLEAVLADFERTEQGRVKINELHREIDESMEAPLGNLLAVMEKILCIEDEISTACLRDLCSHLSDRLSRAQSGTDGQDLGLTLERYLLDRGHPEEWIRAKIRKVAAKVPGTENCFAQWRPRRQSGWIRLPALHGGHELAGDTIVPHLTVSGSPHRCSLLRELEEIRAPSFCQVPSSCHREFRRTKPGPRSAAACCTSQASRDSQVQNERPVHPPCWKRHMKRMLSGGSGGRQDPALRTQILHLRHQWGAPKVPHRASQDQVADRPQAHHGGWDSPAQAELVYPLHSGRASGAIASMITHVSAGMWTMCRGLLWETCSPL